MVLICDRKAIERDEATRLAPYAVRSAETRGRQHPETEDLYRTAFQRDRDRIFHSTAFRRLGHKTQVFVYYEGDHFRNRLTHTLEISQIARSIARMLRLNEDLAEAIVLAHDLGHTPFGHAGEDQMNLLMEGDGGFDHNLHSLRVVDHMEQRYSGHLGLNLSYETREGIAKHNTAYDTPPPIPEFSAQGYPTVEAQVADLSDEIAYCAHDADDGLRSGLVSFESLDSVPFWKDIADGARGENPGADGDILRARVVSKMISLLIHDLVEETARQIAVMGVASPDDVRRCRCRVATFSPEVAARKKAMHDFLMTNVYCSPRVMRMKKKARRVMEALFSAFCEDPDQLPPRFRERIPAEGLKRVVCDYVAGMTDKFAIEEHEKMFNPTIKP